MQDAFNALYDVIMQRRSNPQEGSYTCYLFEQGIDKILKKCGEECAETIIADIFSLQKTPGKKKRR
jgi:phosphoribosyl-ATP pyrophosphohydrolase